MSFSRYDEDGARTSHLYAFLHIGARRATHCAMGEFAMIIHYPDSRDGHLCILGITNKLWRRLGYFILFYLIYLFIYFSFDSRKAEIQ